MKIGDEVYVRGNVDEIRQDTVIVRNDGGYFGTVPSEVIKQVPSEDCISKNALISFIDAGHLRDPNEKCYSETDVVELIKDAPSVVPSIEEPKYGHWLEAREEDPCWYRCSECGRLYDFDENYCPNCGAKMIVE